MHRFDEVTCERGIARAVFMGDHIIRYAYQPAEPVFPYTPQYRTQAGTHKRQPVPDHNDIGPQFAQLVAHPEPVQGIDGIDTGFYTDITRGRLRGILRGAGKKESRVLQ
jgi:hypothetical protein